MTLVVTIRPSKLTSRWQEYAAFFEGECLVPSQREQGLAACRALVERGHSGRMELYGEGEPHPRLIFPDIANAAKLALYEGDKGFSTVPFKPWGA
ncbi:MAG: hypothetical protein C0606_03890 [Hyphomicrobiales bacterium]|nr:MAG: hypothetical protein C0606_03890 [Hyphomicrobiales bacterium]